MDIPRELYRLLVLVVQASTGLHEAGAKEALALRGLDEPEESIELAKREAAPTPPQP